MKHSPTISESRVPTRVLCVDDNPDMTAVMRVMLDTDPSMQCVGCLASADHLTDAIRRIIPAPDVVVLDASMPGVNPLEAMREIAEEFPTIRVMIFSGRDDEPFIDRVMNAGARGYLSKRCEPEDILLAVREVAAGKIWRWRPRDMG